MKIAAALVGFVFLVTFTFALYLDLDENQWNKLLCSMFTGVRLFDYDGQPIISDQIGNILAEGCGENWESMKKDHRRFSKNHRYFPKLTASLAKTDTGDLKKPYFCPPIFHNQDEQTTLIGCHAEEQTMIMHGNDHLRTIYISFSPCIRRCVKELIRNYEPLESHLKPAIRFFWVHNYRKSQENEAVAGICDLRSHNFTVETWSTAELLDILVNNSPTQELHEIIRDVTRPRNWKCMYAFMEREILTQKLITMAEEKKRKRKRTEVDGQILVKKFNRDNKDDDNDDHGTGPVGPSSQGAVGGLDHDDVSGSGKYRDHRRSSSYNGRGSQGNQQQHISYSWFFGQFAVAVVICYTALLIISVLSQLCIPVKVIYKISVIWRLFLYLLLSHSQSLYKKLTTKEKQMVGNEMKKV